MTDYTSGELWDKPVQFNIIRKNPPEGCNDQWWEVEPLEVIDWLESNNRTIYMQTLDEDGLPYYHTVIKMQWDE
jgi:hypothetical protein